MRKPSGPHGSRFAGSKEIPTASMMTVRPVIKNRIALLSQFAGFAGVGVIGTAGHYAVLIGLVRVAGVNPLFASAAGFLVGALINYMLNYIFTFRSRKRHREAMSKFLVVALAGLGLNSIALSFGIYVAMWNYLFAQLVATALVLVWNFTINRNWTFSGSREG